MDPTRHQWMVCWTRTTPLPFLEKFVTKTAAKLIRDTVEFPTPKAKLPILTTADTENKSALELTEALKNPSLSAPFFQQTT